MPKVKISDIKSGSENVKDVFRVPMTSRTWKWLDGRTFTNKEIQEIFDICENIEKSKVRRKFYQRLILSQKGPFDGVVFRIFVSDLFESNAMKHLLINSIKIDNYDQHDWIKNAILTSSGLVYAFIVSGKSRQYGIDIEKHPTNYTFALYMIKYKDKIVNIAAGLPEFYLEALFKSLDSMDEKLFERWQSTVKYEKDYLDILLKYSNAPANALKEYFDDTTDSFNKGRIALHPNSPLELRISMYEWTDDPKYLPKDVQDIFIFQIK